MQRVQNFYSRGLRAATWLELRDLGFILKLHWYNKHTVLRLNTYRQLWEYLVKIKVRSWPKVSPKPHVGAATGKRWNCLGTGCPHHQTDLILGLSLPEGDACLRREHEPWSHRCARSVLTRVFLPTWISQLLGNSEICPMVKFPSVY